MAAVSSSTYGIEYSVVDVFLASKEPTKLQYTLQTRRILEYTFLFVQKDSWELLISYNTTPVVKFSPSELPTAGGRPLYH